MKAVMLSIKPKYCELIASGKKIVEVRKTKPKLETPFKCYVYCTKDKSDSLELKQGNKFLGYKYSNVNGKVIGEFVCDGIVPLSITYSDPNSKVALKEFPYTCLTDKEIINYLGNGKQGYGWHISNLVIYDKPKELSEFWSADRCPYASNEGCTYEYHCFRSGEMKRCGNTISRPPQSWCYVEDLEVLK